MEGPIIDKYADPTAIAFTGGYNRAEISLGIKRRAKQDRDKAERAFNAADKELRELITDLITAPMKRGGLTARAKAVRISKTASVSKDWTRKQAATYKHNDEVSSLIAAIGDLCNELVKRDEEYRGAKYEFEKDAIDDNPYVSEEFKKIQLDFVKDQTHPEKKSRIVKDAERILNVIRSSS